MTESDARKIFLVRAVERIDPKGGILAHDLRADAGKEAGGTALLEADSLDKPESSRLSGDESAFLAARAGRLEERLRQKNALPKRMDAMSIPGWLGPVLIIGVLLAGFFSANLGRDGAQLNILALPLLGILAWNLVVYVLALIGLMTGASGRRAGFLTSMARKLGKSVKERPGNSAGLSREEEVELAVEWFEEKLPIHSSRLGTILHIAAAALAVGGVGGLFYQGWAVEYRAVWESTLFTADSLSKFFGFLFAPASWVSGIEIPLDTLPEIQRGAGLETMGGSALPWLQLYAVTMGIFVVVPRLVFAVAYRAHTARLRANFPLSQSICSYLIEILRGLKGESQVAVIIPYAYVPESRARDAVRALLHDLWGGGIFPEFIPPVDYGDEDEFVEKPLPNDPRFTVVLMNFSTTPEDEVQGFLGKSLRDRLTKESEPGDERSLLILLDAAGFTERFHALPEFERRASERTAAWERVMDRAGIGVATINLPGQNGTGHVSEIAARVWSTGDGTQGTAES